MTALQIFLSPFSEPHAPVPATRAFHDHQFPYAEHDHQALGVVIKLFRFGFFFLHIYLTLIADRFVIFKGLHVGWFI